MFWTVQRVSRPSNELRDSVEESKKLPRNRALKHYGHVRTYSPRNWVETDDLIEVFPVHTQNLKDSYETG